MKHIDVQIHNYVLGDKQDDKRASFYLSDDSKYIDSFDINYKTGKIRFYSCTKEFSLSNIPECKNKIWKIDFMHEIISKLTNAIIVEDNEYKRKLYQDSLDSIVNSCVK